MDAIELLTQFQRMVHKQDYWRGYVDDEFSDDDVDALLEDAKDALRYRQAECGAPPLRVEP